MISGVHWGDFSSDEPDALSASARRVTFRAAPGRDLAQTNVRLGDIVVMAELTTVSSREEAMFSAGGMEAGKMLRSENSDLGTVFTGKGMGDINGVHLVDIYGDFRADWLWLDDEGKVTTYIRLAKGLWLR
ncbi:hypothetical protein N7508_004655 [Penicillium antarcticum]|uniref:uncharacterized protein n=1 Tax=Penicillium antarcticum TaxID=416450 RepID=UPI00239718E7|nr:uncharacterized protein N7508_004655 [Penicillium antarcticum]KAJ5309276.1 hypothetical protein N7508_004655 [Penicillium antarcticum]